MNRTRETAEHRPRTQINFLPPSASVPVIILWRPRFLVSQARMTFVLKKNVLPKMPAETMPRVRRA